MTEKKDRKDMAEESGKEAGEAPRTAVGEVLAEFEEAETQLPGTGDQKHRGQEGDALTTNEQAQEETAYKED